MTTTKAAVKTSFGSGSRNVAEVRKDTRLPVTDIEAAIAELIADGYLVESRWGGWFPVVDANGKPYDRIIGIRTTR